MKKKAKQRVHHANQPDDAERVHHLNLPELVKHQELLGFRRPGN